MSNDTKKDKTSNEAPGNFPNEADTRPLKKISKTQSNIKRSNIFSRFFKKRKNIDDFIKHEIISTDLIEVEKNELDQGDLNDVNKNYNFVYKFAEGGQGLVYSAIDKTLGRLVAIKTLRSEFAGNEKYRKNFISEAKITAQLDHPGIVPVYSLNSDENSNLFMAMKLVHGQSLDEYLNKIIFNYQSEGIDSFDEEKSLRSRLEIILDVCDALAYAHSKNIMHCDLKGENIMIGEFHEVFVTDWGFARFIVDNEFNQANWQKPDKLVGTPGYLSPEAIKGEYTDQRADIFSIGAVLFKLVFLKNAFDGQSADEIISKIHEGKHASFKHKFNFRVSRDLIAVIKKALANNPKHRYQKISALAEDIRKYLNFHAVSARSDNFLSKFIRWSKRHTAFVIIIAFLGIAAAFVSLSYNYLIQKFIMPRQHQLENQELIELVNSIRKLENSSNAIHNLGNSMQQIANISALLYLNKDGSLKDEENDFHKLKFLTDLIFEQNQLLLGIKLTLADGNIFHYCRHNCPAKTNKFFNRTKLTDEIKFSIPCYDKHLKQFVNYLELPITDRNKQLIGVLTLIIDLNKIRESVTTDEANKAITDLLWINHEGEIIFRRSSNYQSDDFIKRAEANNNQIQDYFEDKPVWGKIKQQKFGIAFANGDNNSDIIYSFIHFHELDLFYVEKINLAELKNFQFQLHENYWELIKNFYKQCFTKQEN
ncbi:MAG: protein kinase [Lentisphaeria bacterium]|nr:protein kinase [Lentisphaeria bacterium]